MTRRLVLIRLLLARAEEQARQSQPYSADAVNRLHDVVEMFLALAAERHNVKIPRGFVEYWTVLEPTLGRPLAYRAQMQKLNKSRVNLKHYGLEPTTDQISDAVASVRGLVADECPALFEMEIDDISLVDVLTVDEVRTLVGQAEAHWQAGQEHEALGDLAEAFDKLICDYRERKQVWHGHSVFDSVEDMAFLEPSFRGVSGDQETFEELIIASLKNLDANLMVVGFGIDLRKYGRFKSITPGVIFNMDGKRHLTPSDDSPRTLADFEYCRDFVVSSAIHLAEFDFDSDFWVGQQNEKARRTQEEE